MNSKPPRIVGAGLFALDVIVSPDGVVTKSTLGGSAGNVLAILAALGWDVVPVGTLGNDSAGGLVREDFRAVGADLQFMTWSNSRCTPVVYQHQQASHDTCTHRFSFACPTCGRYRRPQWDDDSSFDQTRANLPDAGAFFLDRPTRLGVELAEYYASTGALVVFEPSAVGSDVALFERALRSSHIVKYADDRMTDLTGFDMSGVAIEIQTCGARGLQFRAPSLDNNWFSLGAYQLPQIKDTAGAGDWCTAGLIYELLGRGVTARSNIDYNTLTRALVFGQVLSSLNCLTEGARGLLASWSPNKIIRSARELSSLRLRSLYSDGLDAASQIQEPKLDKLAADSGLHASLDRLEAHNFACCLSF